jgi:hypothetical protein
MWIERLFRKSVVTEKKTVVKPKTNKKSAAIIYWTLGVAFGVLFGLFALIVFKPDVMDGLNNERIAEQNFQSALVEKARVVAVKAPSEQIIEYKTVNGDTLRRTVIIYGYGVRPDDAKCTQFFNKKDNPKLMKLREVCVYTEKEVKAESLWFDDAVRSASKWKIWSLLGGLHADGQLLSP